MGTYVDKPPGTPFDWGSQQTNPSAVGIYDLVEGKFGQTMTAAEDMMERLVGQDGNSGFLGNLNSIITSYQGSAILSPSVEIPDTLVAIDARPAVDTSGFETEFPEFTASPPSLQSIPTVDLSALTPADMPDSITAAINWIESIHDTTLYSEILSAIMTGLQDGATGLAPAVEQEIYDRALARQAAANTKTYTEIEDYFSSRGFDLPPGAMAGRLQEAASEIERNNLDLNGKIMITQAELAQKNTQFILQMAKDLESVLRDFTSRTNDRSLDYAKAVAANAIALYAENVRAYVAAMEANKAYVEVQVENLKAAIEYNKGLVMLFAAEAEVYGTVVEAKGKKNESLLGAIKAEIDGYDSETRAIAANNDSLVKSWSLKIQNADMQLRAAIAEAESSVKGYATEYGLREKVAESMANIAMQSVASAYGAVNASAGLSTGVNQSYGESWGHNESREVGWRHSGSLNESYEHKFEEQPEPK